MIYQIILGLMVIAFFLLGIRAGIRIERRKQRDASPVCLCTHTLSGHDKRTGACVSTVKRRKYNSIGMREGYHWVPCECVRYIGPVPAADLISPTFINSPMTNTPE